MTDKETFRQIKNDLSALENQEDGNDFDTVPLFFSLLQNSLSLLNRMYSPDSLKQWKKQENPVFDRFRSRLKNMLEYQRDYLASLPISPDEDVISKKIAACQTEIESVLEKENSVRKESQHLFSKEKDLQEQKQWLAELLRKKTDLEQAEKELSGFDLKKLEKEIAAGEEKRNRFQEKYDPLIRRKQVLEKETGELEENLRNVKDAMDNLEQAYGEDALTISENLPLWVEKLRQRIRERSEKDEKYIREMEQEAEELKKTEARLQEHLRQINETAQSNAQYQEILQLHFASDVQLGKTLSSSLGQMQKETEKLTGEIEESLKKYDEMLRQMRQRIGEVTSEIHPLGLG